MRAHIGNDVLAGRTREHERERNAAPYRGPHAQVWSLLTDRDGTVGRYIFQNAFGERSAKHGDSTQVALEQPRKRVAQRVVTIRLSHDVREPIRAELVRIDMPGAAVLREQPHELRTIVRTHAIPRINDDGPDTIGGHCANIPIERLSEIKRIGSCQELV